MIYFFLVLGGIFILTFCKTKFYFLTKEFNIHSLYKLKVHFREFSYVGGRYDTSVSSRVRVWVVFGVMFHT